jgi:DNA-binding GntR family transcriptional regulator
VTQKSGVKTKSAEAYRRLKSKLHAGELDPGQRLTEAGVADMLGMGRTSVREAMLRLESEGLLKGRGAYGGKYVRYIEDENPEDVLHHYELREMVEGLAARLAAKNMTGWQIDELRSLAERTSDAACGSDRRGLAEAASAFHRYLVTNCGNPLLREIWQAHSLMPLSVRSAELNHRMWDREPDGVDPEALLTRIVDAIAAHDPDESEQAARLGIRRVTEAIRRGFMDEQGGG